MAIKGRAEPDRRRNRRSPGDGSRRRRCPRHRRAHPTSHRKTFLGPARWPFSQKTKAATTEPANGPSFSSDFESAEQARALRRPGRAVRSRGERDGITGRPEGRALQMSNEREAPASMSTVFSPEVVQVAGVIIVCAVLIQVGVMLVSTLRRVGYERDQQRHALDALRYQAEVALAQSQEERERVEASWSGYRKFEVQRQSSRNPERALILSRASRRQVLAAIQARPIPDVSAAHPGRAEAGHPVSFPLRQPLSLGLLPGVDQEGMSARRGARCAAGIVLDILQR